LGAAMSTQKTQTMTAETPLPTSLAAPMPYKARAKIGHAAFAEAAKNEDP